MKKSKDLREFDGSFKDYQRLTPSADAILDALLPKPMSGLDIADRYNKRSTIIKILFNQKQSQCLK